MSRLLQQVERLKRLRQAQERIQSASFAAARHRLLELERHIEALSLRQDETRNQAYDGLFVGDFEAWILSRTCDEVLGQHHEAAQKLLVERRMYEEKMRQALLARRMATEKIKTIEAEVQRVVRLQQDRLEQKISDDRYALRMRFHPKGNDR